MSDLTIRNLIQRITTGDIRIPAFQRDYVWESEQAAFLIDSIYKGFPIGIIVFWQTDARMRTEKNLGAFKLPEPKRDYPVNYVLDGQQRLTSLFSVFQSELLPEDKSWVDIYFDIQAENSPQETCFFALSQVEVDLTRHFPIRTFFNTVAYREATEKLTKIDHIRLIDRVQERFKEYSIQNQTFETGDRNEVAIVFERINRAGTELDVFELIAAWSWSDDFDLIEKFRELQGEIHDHGFEDLVDDRDLQLRICAAIITGETSPNKILDLQGDDIRNGFLEIQAGIIGAIDFLKREIGVDHFRMLPFPGILVPLSVFFATDKADGVRYSDSQKITLVKWFWRSVFTKRFSSDVSVRQAADITEMKRLLDNEHHDFRFPRFDMRVDFQSNRFSAGTANSKTLVLMLVSQKPHSFISGASIDPNKVLKKGSRHEFHHIFPKKYLEDLGVDLQQTNCLANICFLTRADNNLIRAQAPSEYFDRISQVNRQQYLEEAFCESVDGGLEFGEFIKFRAARLNKCALKLCGIDME